jgi:hypothetical protein
MHLKSRYKPKRYADGGAVVAPDEAPIPQDWAGLEEGIAVEQERLRNHTNQESLDAWLKIHPEYIEDRGSNAKMQHLHLELAAEGLEPFSRQYFAEADRRLGHNKPSPADDDVEHEISNGNARMIFSAPVSKRVPSSDGTYSDHRITLSREQKEAAKIAGISEASYAQQLLELNRRKAQGDYSGSP